MRWIVLCALAGCGDHCEQLCNKIGDRLAECRDPSLSWEDLGAKGKVDWKQQCKQSWGHTASGLGARDLDLALGVCQEASGDVSGESCDEIIALYGN